MIKRGVLMNNRKMSLKEGFDFLFENEEAEQDTQIQDSPSSNKFIIQGLNPENMDELLNPTGVQDAVINILAFDGIIRKGAGRKSTMALRGATFNKVFTSLNNRAKHIELIMNFVSNKASAESLLEIYASSLDYLDNRGFDRFKALSEGKQISTTIKGADVLDLIMEKNFAGNTINFYKLKTKIEEKISQIVPNLKDDISGKSAGAENLSPDDSKKIADIKSKISLLGNSDPQNKAELADIITQFAELKAQLAHLSVDYRNNEDIQGEISDANDVLTNFQNELESAYSDLQSEEDPEIDLFSTQELESLSSDIEKRFDSIFSDVDDAEWITDGDLQDIDDLRDELGDFITDTFSSDGSAQEKELNTDEKSSSTEEEKVFVKTILKTPEEGDFADFVRKYSAIASFISIISEDAANQLISDSAQDLKAGQLVNLLKKYAKEVGESSRKVLNDSISNLAKFTYKEVDGIIFERAGSSKFFIKINKQKFVLASKLMQQTMQNLSPEDAFNDEVLKTFFAPKFQLTDSSGNNLFTNIDGAISAFRNANTSKKSISLVKEPRLDSDLGKIVFKIENRPVMELTSELRLIIKNPVDLPDMREAFVDFAEIGGTSKSFATELGLSKKQSRTVINFMRSISDRDEKAISAVISQEGELSDEDKQKLEDAAKSSLLVQEEDKDQQVTPEKSDAGLKQSVSSVNDLLNHKDIRTMMDRLYLDNSLTYAISSLDDTQLLKIKNGGVDQGNIVKSMLITSLNPDLTGIKNEIRNLCSDGSENRKIFDSVFFSPQYNEDKFKAAYGSLIMSAFDKMIRGKNSRIAEGILGNAWKFLKATTANVVSFAIPAAILLGGLWMFGATIPAWVSLALGSFATGKSLYDAMNWKKEAENYRDNPIKYITESLDDKNISKVVKGILNAAAADVVIKAINVNYDPPSAPGQSNLTTGKTQFSKSIEEMSTEYNKLSSERKSDAKALNEFILDEMSNAVYYQKGIVSESIINAVFNGVMFGPDRVSDECREQILLGQFDLDSDYRTEFIQSLIKSIKKSPVKNNFVDYIEQHTRKNTGKGRYRFGTREELEQRNKKNFLGMNKSAFVSNEQIKQDYLNELLQDMTGLNFEDFAAYGDYSNVSSEFKEGIHKKDLVKFLFEDTDSSDDLSDTKTSANQEMKDEQTTGDKATYIGLLASSWAASLVNTIKTKQIMIGGANIYKDILAWQTTPGSGGGTPGLFGFKVTASLPKIINTVYKNPTEAKAAAGVGADGLSYQIKLSNGKVFQGYYWNGKSAVGSAKAASGMLVDPASGTAKMMGHGSALFKHANYMKKLGILIDAKTGTFSVIKGSGASLIDPNSPDYMNNLKIISTNLQGSIPGLSKVTTVFTAKNSLAGIAGNFNSDSQEFIAKTLYKQLTGKALAGEVPEVDSSFGKYVDQLEYSLRKGKSIVATDVNTKKQFILKGANAVRAARDSRAALKSYVADVKAAAAKFTSGKDQLSWWESSGDVEKQFVADVKAAFAKNIINHKLAGVKTTVADIIKVLDNKAAQQGLDMILPKAMTGGSLNISKASGGAAKKTLLSKVKVVQGRTPKDIPVEIPDGFDYTAWGAKVMPIVGITTKIMSEFVKRGIQGANFAEYYYKIFNPQQVFYADILTCFLGGKIVTPNAKMANTGDDGGHTGIDDTEVDAFMFGDPSQQQKFTPSKENQLTMLASGGFNTADLDSVSSKSGKDESLYLNGETLNEKMVYNVSLSSYLFENKLVTKKNKSSKIKNIKLANEINEHKKLQDMFKNMF
jgi:hypothetical protein